MSSIPKLIFNHPAMIVNDYEKSKDFYIKGLGAEEYMDWDASPEDPIVSRCCYLKLGNGLIELFGARHPLNKPEGSELYNWIHMCYETTDCKASVEAAVAAGAAFLSLSTEDVVMESGTYQYKARYGFVKGPDGETIEFVEFR